MIWYARTSTARTFGVEVDGEPGASPVDSMARS